MVCFVFGGVLMVRYALFLELFQKQNIPYHENSSRNKTCHTMRTAPKTNRNIIETNKIVYL
jgi:hypothetical protein